MKWIGCMKWIDSSRWLLGLTMALPVMAASAEEFVVVASIRPVQWLVEALAPPGTVVKTVLPVGQSAHDYALRPGDVATVRESDWLVWVGPSMEPWLAQLSNNLPPGRSLALQPAAQAQVNGQLYEHEHEHEQAGEAISSTLTADPHIWLDPTYMAAAADLVAEQLQQKLPDQQDVIRARLQVFQFAMASLDTDLHARLAPVKGIGFVVYHDSYAPLVRRYGLNQRAAVWRHEAMATGARDRAVLRAMLQDGSVRCVFYEPEYGREAVAGWLSQEATGVKVTELDPLGASIKAGPNAYSDMMKQLANNISQCLGK